ncbi:MAG TPA: hypothetical protein VF230_19160 [Acidimicrobiales bacterium]
MRLLKIAALVAALCGGLMVAPSTPAQAVTQGVTTFACTAACTASGTIVSTEPVPYVFPFFRFECLTPGRQVYSGSKQAYTTRVAPTTAGLYTYTWSATMRSPYRCIGIAELTVFGASDNFLTDTRVAPFDSQL